MRHRRKAVHIARVSPPSQPGHVAAGDQTVRSSSDPRGEDPGASGGVPGDGAFGVAGAVLVGDGWPNGPAGPAGRTEPSPACITEAEKADKEGEPSIPTMVQRIG